MRERFIERFPLVRPLFVPAILYIGLVILATSNLEALTGSPWRTPVLLAPVIPGLFLALGVVNIVRRLDEMNRKIILESTAVAFAVTLFSTVPLGLLEMGDVLEVNLVYFSTLMTLVWLAAKWIIARRYE
jgi:hypothetical protein